jgi:hypothetical protein
MRALVLLKAAFGFEALSTQIACVSSGQLAILNMSAELQKLDILKNPIKINLAQKFIYRIK